MGRSYGVVGAATNTASSTVPLVSVVQPATPVSRGMIYDVLVGSDAAPADNAVKLSFQRCSARGTATTSIVAQADDPADPAASLLADTVWSTPPTLTASSFLLSIPHNQRATPRWVANQGRELKIPATAGNGLALMPLVVGGSAFNEVFTIKFEE